MSKHIVYTLTVLLCITACGSDSRPRKVVKRPTKEVTIRERAYKPVVPCAGVDRAYPEILLRGSEKLYAVYHTAGSRGHLTEVTPGTYRTTDGAQLKFKVTEKLEIKCLE